MTEEVLKPDFDSIKQLSPYKVEFWSARDLSKLLGYTDWRNFELAIKRAKTACEQVGQIVKDHFVDATKPIRGGKGAIQNIKDYALSRLACYLIGQNGDPRKPEIAAAQIYFAIATHENELHHLREAQQARLHLRERISENNKDLASAAYTAGVLSSSFGAFQNAGYEGLYGGYDVAEIKTRKGIAPREDILDRMGSSELAANDFRVTQTRDKLRRENIIGESKAIETHREIGQGVRGLIQDFGGLMPEDLPAEPSIKPLLDEKKRNRKKALPPNSENVGSDSDQTTQGKLFED